MKAHQLKNREDRKILRQKLAADTTPRTTLSFYRYVDISDPQATRDALYQRWKELGCMGRIYVAHEGINAQMSIPDENFETWKSELNTDQYFADVPLKIAVEDDGKSFFKLTIKVKHRILADGLNQGEFDLTKRGKHLPAKEWNADMQDPDTVVVDMRNFYESEVGHFDGAITPDVETFRESLPKIAEELKKQDPAQKKKYRFYCTGGIRCEKASAYFRGKGFEDVAQLDGGIIEYAHQCREQGLECKFKGKNFVFDERFGEKISDEVIATCHQCGNACDNHTNCKNDGCHLLFIQCNACKAEYGNFCGHECQRIAALPLDEQIELRRAGKANPHANKDGDVKNVFQSRRRPDGLLRKS